MVMLLQDCVIYRGMHLVKQLLRVPDAFDCLAATAHAQRCCSATSTWCQGISTDLAPCSVLAAMPEAQQRSSVSLLCSAHQVGQSPALPTS